MSSNVYQKINQVMKEVKYVKKGATVGFGNNSYTAVSHDDVTRLLHDSVTKNGIVISTSMSECNISRYTVTTKRGDAERYETNVLVNVTLTDIDNPTSNLTVKSRAHAFDTQDKSPGKANSMAVKNALLKLFMLESGDQEESRVDESVVKQQNRQNAEQSATDLTDLRNQLIDILKSKNLFNDKYYEIIEKLSAKQLQAKITEYQG